MGFRFHKVLGILPGVRANISKTGPSISLGPRGADVNVGMHGVTTNASIPGTGVSYRSKVGSKSTLWGVMAVVGGLGWWGFQHLNKIEHFFAPKPAAVVSAAPVNGAAPAGASAAGPGVRYVHRGGSVLREEAKTSGKTLKKEVKGAQVTLISESDGWSKVTDGNITGYMRSSVLGTDPPQ